MFEPDGTGDAGQQGGAGTGTSVDTGAAGGGASGTGAATGVQSDWTSGFDADQKAFVDGKGYKSPSDLLMAYKGAESHLGVPPDQIIRIPKEGDKAAQDAMYKRLGRPETAEGYKLKVGEGADPKFTEFAQKMFHTAGLSKGQADAIGGEFQKYMADYGKALQDAKMVEGKNQEDALKREWGAAFDQNQEVAGRAAKAFGLTPPMVDKLEEALGVAETIKFLHNIGAKMGEADFVLGSDQPGFAGKLTPVQAQQRIKGLEADKEWVGKYLGGGVKEQKEMQDLQQMAYPSVAE